jgi:hypothetical protein
MILKRARDAFRESTARVGKEECVGGRCRFYAAGAREPLCCRICPVHQEKGLTGVLPIASDKPTTSVPATPEEVERVRADARLRRLEQLETRAKESRGGPSGAAYAPLHFCGQEGGEHVRDGHLQVDALRPATGP